MVGVRACLDSFSAQTQILSSHPGSHPDRSWTKSKGEPKSDVLEPEDGLEG